MIDNNVIEELFSPPIGLKAAAVIDGNKLYSSDKLKSKYLKSMEKTNAAKLINPVLSQLIEKNIVIPVFQHKGIAMTILYKFFGSTANKLILGFFDPRSEKVFILIDNQINAFGFSSNYALAQLTLHECIHLFSHKSPSSFMSLFKSELNTYYTSLFTNIFNLKSTPKNIDKIVRFIYDNFENSKKTLESSSDFNSALLKYYEILEEEFSPITAFSKDEFTKILRGVIVFLKLYIANMNSFVRSLKDFRYIMGPLYRAYRDTFNVPNKLTLCVQELIIPSEILCVGVEIKPTSKYAQAYNKLI